MRRTRAFGSNGDIAVKTRLSVLVSAAGLVAMGSSAHAQLRILMGDRTDDSVPASGAAQGSNEVGQALANRR